MGAWGMGTFENDAAADWLGALQDADDETVLRESLEASELSGVYFEAPEGARLLCACEIIAALRGHPAPDLPEEARNWVERHVLLDTAWLRALALGGIDRILGDGSELDDLWRESKTEYWTWRARVLALRQRLEEAPPPMIP